MDAQESLRSGKGEAHSGKGGSELGPGLVRPGAAGPAEGLACRTWASGGGSGRLPASCHLALFQPRLVGAGAGSLPGVGLREGSGN